MAVAHSSAVRGSPPPGGPLNPDFRHAIKELAEQARAEDLQAAEELRNRKKPRPVQKFIQIGLVLIALQSAVFAYLYVHQKPIVVQPAKVAPPKTCSAAVNRTYWKVVAFLTDKGHPPTKLEELLPAYVDKLPADPLTGKPLEYMTDGTRFTLRCPGRGAPVGR
jgi:hypothetical protein